MRHQVEAWRGGLYRVDPPYSRCSFSGGPAHGTTQLVEDWVQGLGGNGSWGGAYYRRDSHTPTRFRLAGSILLGLNGLSIGPYAHTPDTQ